MDTSSSSGSSFMSSSLGRPPTYSRSSFVSPVDSTWTQPSGTSTVSAPSTGGSGNTSGSTSHGRSNELRPLDIGPPGYTATIKLYLDGNHERTIYLGPWEVIGTNPKRVQWQCSYQNEFLEHYLPSGDLSDLHPRTLHSRHRQFQEYCDTERFVSFNNAHHVTYTSDEGVCLFDDKVAVKYEFTTVDLSIQFQGDIRGKDLKDLYDADVVWTNVHGRTDAFGQVKGIGAIQKLKLWRDRYTTYHSLSILANKTDNQYREYDVHIFEGEVKGRDDQNKQLRLVVNGRRGSAPEEPTQRRTFSQFIRPRVLSTGQATRANPDLRPSQTSQPVDIRYLAIQFTHREDYRRFLDTWVKVHSSDREFNGIPFPSDRFELAGAESSSGAG